MEAIQKRLQDYLRSVTNSNLTLGGSRRDMERQLAANDETVRNPRLTLGDLGRSSETGRLVAALKPLSATGRSATFVCPHWGNYVATFTSIAFQLPDESRFIAFRGDDWGESEGLFWKYLNQLSRREVSIYHTDQRRILASIVKEMRNGTHLFVLFDLFRKYGETAPIRFYDAELHVTIGWAKLCYLAQSVVVSVGPASLQRPDILILDVIDPRNSSTQEHFVGECMRALSRSLEILVHENPGYWFMWEHLDKYGRQ
ncbi:hypothetical protein [Mesorhizobium sp. 1M-11]|uniref:hypothetical protein n=1 Tax=Mesorhizobium sp. 1M-11 TaxID=1529006 RepID=UPI000A8147AA|nr:hypothetical protein [Mesorhizobium sp. 1M-11]